jgi:hypothetical protein
VPRVPRVAPAAGRMAAHWSLTVKLLTCSLLRENSVSVRMRVRLQIARGTASQNEDE